MVVADMVAAPAWCISPNLARLSWLRHGFATAQVGDVADAGGKARVRAAWQQQANIASDVIYLPQQVHGTAIWQVSEQVPISPPRQADGIFTVAAECSVAVQTADCVPLLLAHEPTGVVAALHAGWRGVAAGLLPLFLRQQQQQGAPLTGWRIALGPAIGPCCFMVQPDVAQSLCASVQTYQPWQEAALAEQTAINLWGLLWQQCAELGLFGHQLSVFAHCTVCESRWFSFRRQQAAAGRQLSVICRYE